MSSRNQHPDRARLISVLLAYLDAHPNMRVGQTIVCGTGGAHIQRPIRDVFYIEDGELADNLEMMVVRTSAVTGVGDDDI